MKNQEINDLDQYFQVTHGLYFNEDQMNTILDLAQKVLSERSIRATGATPLLGWMQEKIQSIRSIFRKKE